MAYPQVSPLQPVTCPASDVSLTLSCRKLSKTDVLSKSDPMAVVYQLAGDGSWAEYGRTETIVNTQDPDFATPIQMSYRFEEVQKLRFVVYDIDNDTPSLSDDDLLGYHECTLAQIVSAGTYQVSMSIGNQKLAKGNLIIRAEEIRHSKKVLELTWNGVGLDKKDLLGKSDPYLELARENPDGTFSKVHRTEVIKNTLNPFWPTVQIKANLLGGGDETRRIKVTCYDWDADGSHDLIGEFFTSLSELRPGQAKLSWDLINEKKRAKKKGYKNSGVVHCTVKTFEEHSFLDYIVGGCQLNFTVGIDFTGSNGKPSLPTSLHYLDPQSPVPCNQYTEALMAVGYVIQDYDTDKQFPALGFGAKLPGQAEASHEFALNGNPENPYCYGIQGVLDAYRYALTNVKLWGPTNAAPIINHVARFAEQADRNPEAQNYFILLMLTDGELTDMGHTKTAIIRASRLPMSVIIVGVGDADFTSMDALDCDEGLLSRNGETAVRDIVQFVPYRQFKGSSKEALARAVLAEVPKQVVQYFKLKGVSPRERAIVHY